MNKQLFPSYADSIILSAASCSILYVDIIEDGEYKHINFNILIF